MTAACAPIASRQDHAAALESLFPALSRLRVTTYRDEGWRTSLVYVRGSFSKTAFHETCDVFEGPPLQFDAAATTDFAGINKGFAEVGLAPSDVEVTYSDGSITTAVFDVGCAGCDTGSYIYDSGGVSNTEPGPGISEVVLNSKWVWYVER